jgi:hypothetical protein
VEVFFLGKEGFVLEVLGVGKNGDRVSLRSSSIARLSVKEWRELNFVIKDSSTNSRVAYMNFIIRHPALQGPRTYLSTSAENSALALKFFKIYRQSPFRLLLFSSLSTLEKNGFPSFFSGDGVNDNGAAHKRQLRQKIFFHEREGGLFHVAFHKIGEFPRLSLSQLQRILALGKQVPKYLLEPSSPLRKVRAKSFAALTLKRLGKSKYRASRKLMRAKKLV